MGLTALRVHQGPSTCSLRPVIRYRIEFPENVTRDLESVVHGLSTLLPEIRERRCLCASALEAEDVDIRHALRRLFEHLSIELQNRVGAGLECARVASDSVVGAEAVVPFQDEKVGLEAATLAFDAIECLSTGRPLLDWERRVQALARSAERESLPAQDRAMVRAAEASDIPVIRIAGRLIQLGHGRNQQRLSGTKTTHTNVVSNDLASNKDYARRIFRAFGLPIPRYERVYRKEDAAAAADRIGFPVVLKPNQSNMGGGVHVGLRSRQEVREAFERTRQLATSFLVEEYIEGSDYRLLVINGRLEAAARRVAAHVIGDGASTIAELVRRANQDPRRGEGHHSSWTRLAFDDESDRLLAERGYRRGSIAGDGEIIPLKRVANTSAGGTAVDVTDLVHPENRMIAERAAIAVGLDIAGVDLLVRDITQPMRIQGGIICEINSRPGLRKHLWPAEGKPRDVVGPILDMLFPVPSPARIPIAVVTGSGDTHGVVSTLADLLAADGSRVGLAAQQGVFISGMRVAGSEVNGPAATRMLLLDPTVEMAVIEVAMSDALSSGLGYDWADACAVVNGQRIDSSDLVDALQLVVGTARSLVAVSAMDETTYGLKAHPSARVWHLPADRSCPEFYAAALAAALGRQQADIERALAIRSRSHEG